MLTLFLFGVLIGSFLSVVIPRFHDNVPGILKGRSHCENCKKQLKARELIPLLSYLILRGKCSSCDKSISWFYPIVELTTAAFFAVSLPFIKTLGINPIKLGVSGLAFDFELFLLVFWLFCLTILIVIFFYDAMYLEIDDRLMIPAIIIIGVIVALIPDQNIFPNIKSALLGALIPFAFFGIQILISKGKWIGSGDLRIGIIIGLILGAPKVLVALFLSYMLGSLFGILIACQKGKLKGIKIPFGPFLTLSTFISFFFGQAMINWYLNFIIY